MGPQVDVLLADDEHTRAGQRRREDVEGGSRRHHDVRALSPGGAREEQVGPEAPPPPHSPVLGKQHHRRQAPEGTGEAALAPALVVGRHHFDTGWERDVRRIAVADRAEHRHVVSLGEVAGDVEAGARGAAHSPGVGEQDDHAPALARLRAGAQAHRRRQGGVQDPVRKQSRRPAGAAQQRRGPARALAGVPLGGRGTLYRLGRADRERP